MEFGKEKPIECQNCKYRILCNGGCKNDWEDGHNYYCESFKIFFDYAIDRLLEIGRTEILMRKQMMK